MVLWSHANRLIDKQSKLDSTDTNVEGKKGTYYILPSMAMGSFINRPALMQQLLERSITKDGAACSVVVLIGMGGQGKTRLVMEFCRVSRLSRRFNAIFWIDAMTSKALERSFEDIAGNISGSASVFDNMASKIAFVRIF